MVDRLNWDSNHQTEGSVVVLKNAMQEGSEMDIASILMSGTVLKKGKKDKSNVQALQQQLLDLGYRLPNFGADGDFGNETYNAVIQFQADYQIAQDGIAGSETGKTLAKLLNGQLDAVVPYSKTVSSKSTSKVQSDNIGLNPNPIIETPEPPKETDFIAEYGLIALGLAGLIWYGKKEGWFDEKKANKNRKRDND